MSFKRFAVPVLAAAAIALGLSGAPTALAAGNDPCTVAVSTSRCLGPQGIGGFSVPQSGTGGVMNGPYGAWGAIPPLG
jgi:hypothetical protein